MIPKAREVPPSPEPQAPQKNSGPPTDAGATNFVRSTQAHSGLQCPELAQLRPQIVPWSTLGRADWVRNDPCPYHARLTATPQQRPVREAMRTRGSIRGHTRW